MDRKERGIEVREGWKARREGLKGKDRMDGGTAYLKADVKAPR